jgi:hypothetical protein
MQIFSIVLSILAIAIALIGLGGANIRKGNSGEWAPIALLPAFIIGLLAGAVALVLSLITRSGVPPCVRFLSACRLLQWFLLL